MVPGLQITGLFLAITAVLAFTAWAETWLASAVAAGNKRESAASERSDQVEVIRAA